MKNSAYMSFLQYSNVNQYSIENWQKNKDYISVVIA